MLDSIGKQLYAMNIGTNSIIDCLHREVVTSQQFCEKCALEKDTNSILPYCASHMPMFCWQQAICSAAQQHTITNSTAYDQHACVGQLISKVFAVLLKEQTQCLLAVILKGF